MNRIRKLRAKLKLSADQAARRAGISTSMWIKVERGERTPSLPIARKIAAALGCTLDDIFLTSDYPERVSDDEHAAALDPAVGTE